MKRLILGGLLATAGAASGDAFAGGWDDTGAIYLNPMLQYSIVDRSRDSKDGFGVQVGIGDNFMPNFAAELNYSSSGYKFKGYDGSAGPSEKVADLTLDVLYKFLPPSSLIRPYVIAGAGALDDTIGGHFETAHAWVAEAGVGMLTGLGNQSGSTRLQLRTEAKYRREFIQNTAYIPNNPGDVVFGVGLQLSFGNPTPPRPIVAAPPPPPPPPVVVEAPPPPPPCNAPAGFKVDANCRIIQQSVVVRAVDFEYNSVQLTVPAQQTLNDVASALQTQPELNVEIQGHTDSIGSVAYNLNLSQRRADSVKAYLVSKGVSSSVLTAKGYGKSQPIDSNATPEGRAQNRRVAFEVTNPQPHVTVVKEDASAASTEAAKQGEPPNVQQKEQKEQKEQQKP